MNRRHFLEAAGAAVLTSTTVEAATSKARAIFAADAPKPVGPYSHAIRAGNTLYLSGQVGLDPATGNLVEGDVAVQTRRALENLRAVLKAAGAELTSVVKCTVFLTDVANFQTMNGVYAEFFGDHKPARSTVGVAALPRGAGIEIEMIAVV